MVCEKDCARRAVLGVRSQLCVSVSVCVRYGFVTNTLVKIILVLRDIVVREDRVKEVRFCLCHCRMTLALCRASVGLGAACVFPWEGVRLRRACVCARERAACFLSVWTAVCVCESIVLVCIRVHVVV